MARDSIPVPSSQQSRQQQSTRQAVNQAARDQQPPWRSSLDLVWSYSRSQAFYGDNLGTSPSFVDRHWAGPTRRDENGQLIEDSLDEYDEDEDGSEYLEEYSGTEADSAEENDNDESATGAMEWEGEQLPRNALSSGSNSGMNGRRRSGGGRSSRRRNSNSKRNSTSSGPRDRRISRLEDEESLDEERSRSRSRSPKRLGSGGNLRRDQHKEGSYLNPNRTNSYSSSSDSNSNYSNKPNSKDLNNNSIANENTPLLSTSGGKGSNGFLSANRRSISGTSSTGSSGYKSSLRLQYGQGTSTFLQSWFNTLNALVGVGILALPLAFSYSGWIGGTVLFLICGGLTNYTGKVLAKIMSKEPGLKTYSDIGAYAFGANARLVVSLLFCLELWAVSVALIILFGDSVYAMFGGYLTPAAFKAIGLAIILPTIFLPLNLLSPVSVIGIVSTFTLFGVVLLDGIIKKEAPGSLWQPATTHLLPEWSRFPLSFGLIMSGFSSHPIIPSLYKDMRDPRKFSKMLNLAYVGATIIYLSMGMVGYAMFGYKVSGEITQDLSRTPGYPHFLNKMAIWLIALNPLTKFALATRPINTTFESLFGLEALFIPPDSNFKKNSNFSGGRMTNADEDGVTNPDVILENEQANGNGNASGSNITGETTPTPTPTQQNDNPLAGSAIALRSAERTKAWSPRFKLACRLGLRLLIAGLITVTAIVLPGFEKVMAFLGAFLASSTCVFGPLLANLKLFHSSMSRTRIAIDVFILAAVFCFAVIGTVWTFMSFD